MQVKRRFARWQIKQEAKVKLEGAEAFAHCAIIDISLMGARISLALKLAQDTFLKLGLILSEGIILNVEAWVVWRKGIDGHNVYGLYFTKIKDPDKEKIYKFIRSHFPEQMNTKWWEDVKEEKGGETMEDKRIFERFKAQLPLRFLNLTNGKEGLAETRDISAKGIGLVATEKLVSRTPLEVWVEVPNGGSPLYCRGEVAWSKSLNAQECWAGINLEEADLMGVARVLRAAKPKAYFAGENN